MTHPHNSLSVMHLISSLEVGGAEVMLLALLKEASLHSDLKFVTVVLNDLIYEDMRAEAESINTPVYFFLRNPSDKHIRHIFRLLALIDQHQIQVIHTHDPGSKLAAVICKLLRPYLKVIFTVHDTHIIDQLSKPILWIHRLLLDGHIAISSTVEAECRSRGIKNVKTIYNGVNIKKFQRKQDELPGNRSLRLVQIARYELKKKGQDILLRAIQLCQDRGYKVECSLVGMVSPSMESQFSLLKSMIDKLNLTQQVNLLINRTDMPDILAAHDIFILPSRKEGFGLVIIEAMASGLPVIASNLDGPSEIIQDGENGLLFKPESAEHLAEQIIKLHQNPLMFKAFVELGYQTAERFSIEAMATEYKVYYRESLSLPV